MGKRRYRIGTWMSPLSQNPLQPPFMFLYFNKRIKFSHFKAAFENACTVSKNSNLKPLHGARKAALFHFSISTLRTDNIHDN